MMTKPLASVFLTGTLLLLPARAGFSQPSSAEGADLATTTIVVDGMMKSKSGAT